MAATRFLTPTTLRELAAARGSSSSGQWTEQLAFLRNMDRYDPLRSTPAFRRPSSSSPLAPGTPVRPHPALSGRLNILASSPNAQTYWKRRPSASSKWEDKEFPAARLPLAGEFATSPAARRVKMEFDLLDLCKVTGSEWGTLRVCRRVENPEGVKVADILSGSAALWSSSPPEDVAKLVADVHNGHPYEKNRRQEHGESEEKPEDVRWVDVLFDHNGFTMFDEVEVLEEGIVKLAASHSDS